MESFRLDGEVAILTGGNGGIGLGIARGFASAGASVMVAARNEAKSEAAVSELREAGAAAESTTCDVRDEGDVQRAVDATIGRFGRLDILVNNAGVGRGGPPEELSTADWDLVLDTNLKANFLFARAAFPHLRAGGGGKVINIGSEYSIFGSPVVLSYSASKGGVVQLTKSLAIAWAKHNIQVNCIIPGWITTDMTQGVINNPTTYERIVQRTPAQRFGEPDELAGLAVLLASQASNFITGQSIAVDGGFSIA